MRVVIDTNIFVSSFLGFPPRRIIDLWKNGRITLCLSKDILDEYFEVLQRIGLKNEEELKELLSLLSKGINIIFTAKTHRIKVVRDDPDDDKFIECAVALKAEVIVSGDKAVKEIGDYMGIRILSPRQFVDQYEVVLSGKS